VANFFQPFQNIAKYCEILSIVAKSWKIFLNVAKYCQMLLNIVKSCKILTNILPTDVNVAYCCLMLSSVGNGNYCQILPNLAKCCQMLPNDGNGTDLLLCLLMVSSPYPTILPLALWMGEGELAATTFSKYTFSLFQIDLFTHLFTDTR
jgi:hypothetical protein